MYVKINRQLCYCTYTAFTRFTAIDTSYKVRLGGHMMSLAAEQDGAVDIRVEKFFKCVPVDSHEHSTFNTRQPDIKNKEFYKLKMLQPNLNGNLSRLRHCWIRLFTNSLQASLLHRWGIRLRHWPDQIGAKSHIPQEHCACLFTATRPGICHRNHLRNLR